MRRRFLESGKLAGKGIGFRRAVLNHATQAGTLFSTREYPYSSEKQNIGHSELLNSLPVGEDIIYRGTAGTDEIMEIMRSGEMGTGAYTNRLESLDLPEYIEVNESSLLLSASPCRYTVQEYAEGYAVLPTKGYIIVMGLPKVSIRPQLVAHLDEEVYDEYARRRNTPEMSDGVQGIGIYKAIRDRAKGNNEVTIILSKGKGKWNPEVGTDIMKIVEIIAPGKFLKNYMAAKKVHSRTIDNEEFIRRPWAIEIATTRDSRLPEFKSAYERMNRRADEFGLISDGRLMTLDDADAIMKAGILEEFTQGFTADRTLVFREVPKEIALGNAEALTEFMISEIKSKLTLEEIARAERPTHF